VTASAPAELERLRRQNATFRQLVAIHDRLGGLVLQGADEAAITRVLAELIGHRVLLLDAQLQVLAMAPPDGLGPPASPVWAPEEPYVSRVLGSLAGEQRPLRVPAMPDWGVDAACVLAPVAVGGAMLGYLAILEGENVDLQIVQHAAAVYALSLMRERMAEEVTQQLKNELFEGLLLGRAQDEQVAQQRAVRLGYDPSLAYRALVLALAPSVTERADLAFRRRRTLERLVTVCSERCPRALVTVHGDELVLLAPEADAAELARVIREHASILLPAAEATVGIGGVCDAPQAISRSYEQARRAISTAVRFGKRGQVVALEDLGLYRLLFHVSDPAELRGFVDQVLGALVEYDRQHQASLVETLATFLANNGSLQASARDLDLHVNSVAYRLQRIQSIAGLDLDRAEDRLLAHVAIKIRHGST
jgi:PucR family transcriptional regulator, purine catabolism regulatory protein